MNDIDNLTFLQTLFGAEYPRAHVTSFPDDPSNISNERRGICWAGHRYDTQPLEPGNQYFTISLFQPDPDTGRQFRRKALFEATCVIVADDVKEKLPVERVQLLPPPTYIMETSPGSEQWGWVLTVPETNRQRVENLLDGLVERGLAPDGKDPGMKGVTRYVRLPEGVNTKASRNVIDFTTGRVLHPRSHILHWSPFDRASIEQLAEPFGIDLDAERRDSRVDGADLVPDHPLLSVPDLIQIKDERSPGRYDVTCPWVDEHTGGADDGAAIFTNADGSMGFKCHHGSCQHRTGRDLMNWIEERTPGFRERYRAWQVTRLLGATLPAPPPSSVAEVDETTPEPAADGPTLDDLCDRMERTLPTEAEALELVEAVLRICEDIPAARAIGYRDRVRTHMLWTKRDLDTVLKDYRNQWYKRKQAEFFKDAIFVSEQNSFWIRSKRMFLTPEAFQNSYGHIDDDARNRAIYEGLVEKVDRVDYRPGEPEMFVEAGTRYANSWIPLDYGNISAAGDASTWLNHFDTLGWQEYKEHLLQWMAFTLRHPETKINHAIVLGGKEGVGKDFLLYPLMQAFGVNATTVESDEIASDFNEYRLGTKWLHINEAEMGSHKEAAAMTRRLKALVTSPPDTLRVNIKGQRPILVKNLLNVSMCTNSMLPFKSADSRRYYPVWSDLTIRDSDGQPLDGWSEFWTQAWAWMQSGGWRYCIHHLMTQVDLSNFNPGSPPGMTDFGRDIRANSKGEAINYIADLIEDKVGLFEMDIMRPKDITLALKAAVAMDTATTFQIPSETWVSRKLVEYGMAARVVVGGAVGSRLLIIRNHREYADLRPSAVHAEWQRQKQAVSNGMPLKVVE